MDPEWQRQADDLVAAGTMSRITADVLLAEAQLTGSSFPALVERQLAPSPAGGAPLGQLPTPGIAAMPSVTRTPAQDLGHPGAAPSAMSQPPAVAAAGRPSNRAPGVAGDTLTALLSEIHRLGGSDLHLTAGSPAVGRFNGVLRPMEGLDRLDSAAIVAIIQGSVPQHLLEHFDRTNELDTSLAVPGIGRVRCNLYRQRGSVGAAFRLIPNVIPDLSTLGLPPVVRTFADLPRGLVLVTGPTGSGKSTTLASIIDLINRSKRVHIMSCEDPIEFVHQHKSSIVNQREVGVDTASFAEALRHVLRQDPDVILVGEMRDLETIQIALTAAETGHLVFATLHTQSASTTIDRVIDVFPGDQQAQVRAMLASTLQAVVTQQLLPTADGRGRAVAVEVMTGTPAVRALIREGKVHQLPQAMQTGGARHGMITMDAALAALVRSGRITRETAVERAGNPDELRTQLGGG
jgi:twitching motility protein PilT